MRDTLIRLTIFLSCLYGAVLLIAAVTWPMVENYQKCGKVTLCDQ